MEAGERTQTFSWPSLKGEAKMDFDGSVIISWSVWIICIDNSDVRDSTMSSTVYILW